ncbi:MAG TPA: exopolysaccharide biosynthesis polyprenyl glycosylphosphotransferase [Vampirovibrionales bacterium]
MPQTSFKLFSLNTLFVKSKKQIICLLDAIFLLFSLWFSHFLFEYPVQPILPVAEPLIWGLFIICVLGSQFCSFYISDLYTLPSSSSRLFKLQGFYLILSSLITILIISVFCFITKFPLGRDVLLLAGGLSLISTFLSRLFFLQLFAPKYLALLKPIKCIFLYKGPLSENLLKEPCFLRGYKEVTFDSEKNLDCLEDFILEAGIKLLLVDTTLQREVPQDLLEKLVKLKFKGVEVRDVGSFYEQIVGKLPLLHLPENWFLNSQLFQTVTNYSLIRFKRLFDLTIVSFSLPIALPLILLGVIGVKLFSKGPAFYSQKRVGANGKHFTIHKLRSMEVQDEDSAKVQWTEKNDPRITPIGKLLRSTRIDELPQLWNILKGDMSCIGPRPERPEYTSQLQKEIPYYDLRHSIRPGISGWAQVNEPYASPSDSLLKLEYDLFYIRNLSLFLEIEILLKTVRVVLMRKGR